MTLLFGVLDRLAASNAVELPAWFAVAVWIGAAAFGLVYALLLAAIVGDVHTIYYTRP